MEVQGSGSQRPGSSMIKKNVAKGPSSLHARYRNAPGTVPLACPFLTTIKKRSDFFICGLAEVLIKLSYCIEDFRNQ